MIIAHMVCERMAKAMAEYIEKNEVIKLIQEDKVEITPQLLTIATFASPNGYSAEVCYKALNDTCDRHITEIRNIPAADVVVRHNGTNIATDYDGVDQFVCSECGIELRNWVRVERDDDDGDETHYEYRFNFCPNCGAKMDGAE